MKRKLIIAGALFALFNVAVYGQQPPIKRCGTAEYVNQLEQKYPWYAANRQQINDFAAQWAIDNPQQPKATIVIPVVVHVVYKTNAQNISDAQVLSQIPVLNADYRRLNADASNTPSVWQSIAADAGIEFCMASVDPNGAATNGITRTQTTVTTFSDVADDMKSSATGGADPWPSNKYLNIWVCNISSTTLGFTTPPGGPANLDGVVIGYKYYGTTGTVVAPFDKGRTATHEIGHWLNLDHVWGDDGGGCGGSDQVSDTPNQGAENYGCPSFPLTDNCSTTSPGVMFMNYMDYVDDNCMNMFTAGQKTRMLACLNGIRSSIKSSNGCGNGTVITPGDCDTLSNIAAGNSLLIYGAVDNNSNNAGFIAGNNTFGDKAKAEKFTGVPSNMLIKGGLIAFGVAKTANGSGHVVTAAVWNTSGNGGTPGATELATKDIQISSITTASVTAFTFASPIAAPSSFYMGIEWTGLNGNDSIAMYTNNDGDTNPGTAWEKWSDDSWHNFNTPNASGGWEINVSQYIKPILCPVSAVNEETVWDGVSVYPNPTDGNINVYLKLKTNDDVSIRVFNPMGQLITSHNSANTNGGIYNFDLNSQAPGLYFVEVKAGNISRTFKVIVAR